MDFLSSYEVKIVGTTSCSVSATIADSPNLVLEFLHEVWELSNHKVSIKDDQKGAVGVVGLAIECCDDDGDGSFSSINKHSKVITSAFGNCSISSINTPSTFGNCSISSINTHSKVATLALCCGTRGILIQLLHLKEIPICLKKFLANDSQTYAFAGMGIRNVFAKLESDYGLKCQCGIELGPVASRIYRKSQFFDSNLEDLAREIAGIDIEKPTIPSLSLWGARDLRNEQIEYAITKAYAFYSIGEKLMKRGIEK